MKNKLLWLGFVACAALWCASCGGGASSGSGGTATVASLSSLPSVDLSNYDYSSSGAGAMLVKADASGTQMSRAGCETNVQKDNAIKQSMISQLSRCYPEAMEAGGLITIPTDSYAYYKILVPSTPDFVPSGGGDDSGLPTECATPCAGATGPDDASPECQTCMTDYCSANPGSSYCADMGAQVVKGGGEIRGGTMYMRLGRFNGGNELRVDQCLDVGGTVTQVDSSTYTASANDYHVSNVHKSYWGTSLFQGSFDVVFQGATVSNGVVTFDASGEVVADGVMIDDFGRGRMHFGAFPATLHNEIQGVFDASFVDPTGKSNAFLNKVYALFGGPEGSKTGTALFTFEGEFPGFHIIPPEGAPPTFWDDFSTWMGQAVTAETWFCPPADPEACTPDNEAACKPVVDADGLCNQAMENTESFSITGIAPDLLFTVIANDASSYFATISSGGAAVLAALEAPAAGTEIAFTRVWDCAPSGSWSVIDPQTQFSSGSSGVNLDALKAKMQTCVELESSMDTFEGMDEYNCAQTEAQDDIPDQP